MCYVAAPRMKQASLPLLTFFFLRRAFRELCHSHPCPCPSQFVEQLSGNKWVQYEVRRTFLGRGTMYILLYVMLVSYSMIYYSTYGCEYHGSFRSSRMPASAPAWRPRRQFYNIYNEILHVCMYIYIYIYTHTCKTNRCVYIYIYTCSKTNNK